LKKLKSLSNDYEFSFIQKQTSLGRKNADIIVDDNLMSKTHCIVHLEDDEFYLEDKGSTNGTFINDKKIQAHQKIKIHPSDTIKIGSFQYRLIESTSALSHKSSELIDTSGFEYVGESSELMSIMIRHFIFTLITLGLYAPYAKTHLRKYFWSHTQLQNQPFHFFGKASELFIAYIKVVFLYFFLSFLLEFFRTLGPSGHLVTSLLTTSLILVFFIRAKYGAHRYLMNRSSFRNINFYMDRKGSWKYTLEILIGGILSIITFGLYYPVLERRVDMIKWNNSQYGSLKFSYDCPLRLYYKNYLSGITLGVLTLGIMFPRMWANMHKMKASHIKLDNIRFESDVTGMGLRWVMIKSLLLNILTLGLATPWVYTMKLKYYIDNLRLEGQIDLSQVKQAPKAIKGAFMDQVIDFFDADAM
jgi:uncharacterized membrane protein YjgN (DUF898 family)